MSEGWNSGGAGGAGGEEQYGGRSYGNSNYRGTGGPRRGPGGGGGGYAGQAPAAGGFPGSNGGGYQGNGGGGGGFGGQRRSGPPGAYNGGGGGGGGGYQGSRPNYGEQRAPRPYGGAGGGGGGGYNAYPPEGSASSLLEIDSNKVGMVIGRGGSKIREIQESFNVHVKIGEYGCSMFRRGPHNNAMISNPPRLTKKKNANNQKDEREKKLSKRSEKNVTYSAKIVGTSQAIIFLLQPPFLTCLANHNAHNPKRLHFT